MFQEVADAQRRMYGHIVFQTSSSPDFIKRPTVYVIEPDPVLQGSEGFQAGSEKCMGKFEPLPA